MFCVETKLPGVSIDRILSCDGLASFAVMQDDLRCPACRSPGSQRGGGGLLEMRRVTGATWNDRPDEEKSSLVSF